MVALVEDSLVRQMAYKVGHPSMQKRCLMMGGAEEQQGVVAAEPVVEDGTSSEPPPECRMEAPLHLPLPRGATVPQAAPPVEAALGSAEPHAAHDNARNATSAFAPARLMHAQL